MESEDVQKTDVINLCNIGLTATIAVFQHIYLLFPPQLSLPLVPLCVCTEVSCQAEGFSLGCDNHL